MVRWLWDQAREVRERETASVRDRTGRGMPAALVREVEMAVPRAADRAYLVPVGPTAAVRERAKEQELEFGKARAGRAPAVPVFLERGKVAQEFQARVQAAAFRAKERGAEFGQETVDLETVLDREFQDLAKGPV